MTSIEDFSYVTSAEHHLTTANGLPAGRHIILEATYRMWLWMNGIKANSGIAPLAATEQNLPPQPGHPIAEYAERIGLATYRVIVELALHDRLEPLSGRATEW